MVSELTKKLTGQKMFQIMKHAQDLEKSGKNIIHFEIGDPDFSSPEIAKNALKKALDLDLTKYAPSTGMELFKNACQEVTNKSRGFTPNHDQILATSGANIQIYLACACLINPGDEVIIQDPSFVSYESIINLLGGKTRKIILRKERSFEIDPEEIKGYITEKTKAIIINSPHNPTGSIISKQNIEKIYELCEANNIYLISDEVYGRMVYSDATNKFYSPSSIDKCKNKSIVIHSLSKTYSMTGWRIGAVTGPEDIIKRMGLVFETINSCVPTFIQYAAAQLLLKEPGASFKMIQKYEARRNLFLELLEKTDLDCVKPDGAFYAFVNIKNNKRGYNSEEYCNYMLNKLNIAVCPGNFFGQGGEGYIRFCFANTENNIKEAFERIKSHNE